jgi:hypothetical protein
VKLFDASIVIILVCFAATAVAGFFSYKFLGKDSPVTNEIEQIAEKEGEAIILKETGIDVSPILPQITPSNQPTVKK